MYNVFIIDDEPWSREVVKALGSWEQLGLRVSGEAEDGTAGLRRIGEQRPDIVVTDMRMPGIDGVELLQALHERHPEMKIIVMSGYDDFVYLKGAIRSKAVEYLLKPISPGELNAALARSKEELDRQAGPRSSMFASGEAMQRYAGLRDRIYASLLTLDKERIAGAFDALARGLASEEASVTAAGGSSRIASDLLLMLEQFLAEQDATLEQLLHGVADGTGKDGAVGARAGTNKVGTGGADAGTNNSGVVVGVGSSTNKGGATDGGSRANKDGSIDVGAGTNKGGTTDGGACTNKDDSVGVGAGTNKGGIVAAGASTMRSGASPQEAALAVGELYALAVDGLLTLRQSRSRLEMEDVVAYIDAHFQDSISLETVAGQFLVSREHLSRAFKAQTGENLSDYIVRKRMEKARALISEERLPIKHAAQLSGYEDIAYFYRVFKKHFGITPGELRKEGE